MWSCNPRSPEKTTPQRRFETRGRYPSAISWSLGLCRHRVTSPLARRMPSAKPISCAGAKTCSHTVSHATCAHTMGIRVR